MNRGAAGGPTIRPDDNAPKPEEGGEAVAILRMGAKSSPAPEAGLSWADLLKKARDTAQNTATSTSSPAPGPTPGPTPSPLEGLLAPSPRAEPLPSPVPAPPPSPRVEQPGLHFYRYRGRTREGAEEQSYVSALTQERAVEALHLQGLTILEMVEVEADEALGRRKLHRVRLRSLALFTHQLAILHRSGVSLTRALESLTEKPEDWTMGAMARDLYVAVCHGYLLSHAMRRHPRCFPPHYSALIEVGELSGSLDDILPRLADSLERQVALVARMRAVMTYPLVVVLCAIVLNLVTFRWVLPQFQPIFEGTGVELPWLTSMLMGAVRMATHPLGTLALVLGPPALFLAMRQVLTVPAARAAAERLVLRVPAVGTVLRDFLLVEVFTLMSSLTAAGFTLQRSLDLAAQVTSSRNLAEALRGVSSSLNEGLLLSEAFERRQDLFTALGVHMIAVGESTGRLQDMFSTLAGYYLVEVEFALDSLPAILEPVLMAMVGIMTGVVVLAVFMPIYQIVSALL